MGWLSWNTTRKDMIKSCVANATFEGSTEIRHCMRGNVLWQLIHDLKNDNKYICCTLIKRFGGHEWGYKAMDESCGPVYYTCPKSFIKDADKPVNEWAAEWRKLNLNNLGEKK